MKRRMWCATFGLALALTLVASAVAQQPSSSKRTTAMSPGIVPVTVIQNGKTVPVESRLLTSRPRSGESAGHRWLAIQSDSELHLPAAEVHDNNRTLRVWLPWLPIMQMAPTARSAGSGTPTPAGPPRSSAGRSEENRRSGSRRPGTRRCWSGSRSAWRNWRYRQT